MLESGQTANVLPQHLTFGNTISGAIHGLKFIDTDGNGTRGGGEPNGQGFTFSVTGDPDGGRGKSLSHAASVCPSEGFEV